jgi:hypothetical protein
VFPTFATAARAVARFASKGDQATVIIRDTPAGWLWGWWLYGVPRLGLVPLRPNHRRIGQIWLEDPAGKRCLTVAGEIPPSVLRKVQSIIAAERSRIEDFWVGHMIEKNWLAVDFAPSGDLRVVCYRGTPAERQMTHCIPWRGIAGDRAPRPDDLEIDRTTAELVLRAMGRSRVRVPLRFLAFEGD